MGFHLFGHQEDVSGAALGAVAIMERPSAPEEIPVPGPETGTSIVLTYDGWQVGRLAHSERRVLDALANTTLHLVTDHGTLTIDRDEVIMVVPPPLTEVSPLKLAKQPVGVSVDIGVATLRGLIHVLPGVSPWETWQRSPSGFVAITEATIEFPDGSSDSAETVLVSRHAAHSGLLPAES